MAPCCGIGRIGDQGKTDSDPLAARSGLREDLGSAVDFPHQGVDKEQTTGTEVVCGGQRLRLERVGIRDGQHQRVLLIDSEGDHAGGREHGRVPHHVRHQLTDDQAGGSHDLLGHPPVGRDLGGITAGQRDVLRLGGHLEVVTHYSAEHRGTHPLSKRRRPDRDRR